MDLDLTNEQNILKATARNFFKRECPLSRMKELKEDKLGHDPELWRKMAELGWMGVMIEEEYGGIGGSFLELAIILEAMGEVCYTGPYFSTVVLGGLSVLSAGSEEQKSQILPKLATGELVLAMALAEPGTWYGIPDMKTVAIVEKDSYIINGTKLFVENGHIADYILCAARTDNEKGLTLFLLKGQSPGTECNLLKTLGYDKQCQVVFDHVRVDKTSVIGRRGQARPLLEDLQEKAAAAKCMEMIGVMQAAFNTTVAYAKEREQFGRPIGSFQAVQHHCANMVTEVDGARFLTYQAAWRIAEGFPATREVAMAKAWTSKAAQKVTALAHQIHGAVAFCEEHDLHLYYRKAKAAEVAFGDTRYHFEKLARQLGL